MALTIPLESQELSISFASGFIAKILSFTLSDIGAREDLETSTLDTALSTNVSNMEFTPSLLEDAGSGSFEIQFDPDTTPPSNDAKETMTITWPKTGQMTAGTWACTAYVNGMSITGARRQHLIATISVKFSGDWTVTASA